MPALKQRTRQDYHPLHFHEYGRKNTSGLPLALHLFDRAVSHNLWRQGGPSEEEDNQEHDQRFLHHWARGSRSRMVLYCHGCYRIPGRNIGGSSHLMVKHCPLHLSGE